jgi:hypothetical protein
MNTILKRLEFLAEVIPFKEDNSLTGFVRPYPLFQGNVICLDGKNFMTITTENWKEVNTKMLATIAEEIKGKEKEKALFTIFLIISSAYRIQFLDLIKDELTAKEIGTMMSWIWTDTEFPNQYETKMLINLFEKSDKETLMDEDDKKFYDNLPEVITIYRGKQTTKAKRLGMSWTLNKEKANWFAHRWQTQQGKLYQATIEKKYVYAYLNNREEQEVVVDPSKLKGVICLE